MIQPDMLLMRITSPIDSAIAPVVTRPSLHSQIASAEVPVMRKPLSAVMLTSMAVVRRVVRRCLSISSPIASATYASSRRVWANSFSVITLL